MTSRVALVTGGSRGLGLAVTRRFVERGFKVYVVARNVLPIAMSAWAGPSVVPYACDVSKPDQVEALVKTIKAAHDSVDVLVCCAGVYGPIGPAEETWWGDWAHTIQVNLLGTVLCCRAVVPLMRAQGAGRIITLSGGGEVPRPNFSAYNTSKAAVVRFTETLARELAGTGIDVNAIAPGALDTSMRAEANEVPPADGPLAMQRAVDLIEFLAGEGSNGITGKLISAVWDDWRVGVAECTDDDMYTMRRKVPSDNCS